MAGKFGSVDEYIASFPEEVQAILRQVCDVARRVMPGAEEIISYDMPTFVLGKKRIYFAAWKKHLAIYAVPGFDGEPEACIASYRSAKDTVQFPYKQPIPYDLIERIFEKQSGTGGG
jgi:uncharacterized protein YdhG (YjbR/CyaY superfamily)